MSAQHLQKFFDKRAQLISPGKIQLEQVPHDDFAAFGQSLDKLTKRLNLGSQCILNFTGGNKLMATAAFRWAEKQDVKSFYLERNNRLTWFEPSSSNFITRSETLDGNITNPLDPLALLRCQLFASEVERDGEKLTLNERGQKLADDEFYKQVRVGKSVGLMEKTGYGDRESKKGDRLEYNTAAILLKLGIREVRRSLRLRVKTSGSGLPHAEIDLLFNWNGKLWLVDCKDRMAEDELIHRLRRALPTGLSQTVKDLLDRIGSELKISPTKVLKEDLIAINEMGGLLGQVVCVRKSSLSDEVRAYAKRNRIEVVQKNDIFDGFRRLLYPHRPASGAQLTAFKQRFERPSGQTG